MPQAQPQAEMVFIPAGDHILTLVSVEEKQMPSYNNPEETTPRWVWQFKSQTKNPDTGERYEYREYTGPSYGDSRARLTFLLDQMFPDLDEEDKTTIDTDDYIGTHYSAIIASMKNTKGEMRPKITSIRPYKKPAKVKAPPPPDDDDLGDVVDPFKDE